MGLQENINQYLKDAMKAKDTVALESLRAIKSALLLLQTEQLGKEISAEEELKLLQKLAKQRKESAAIYQQQNRADLAEVELSQLQVIERFLPAPLAEEEIRRIVKEEIAKQGATSQKDMGRVMAVVSKELLGRADGKLISSIVKELLV